MKLDELLKSNEGKTLTAEVIAKVMEEMTSIKLKAVNAKEDEIKKLIEKITVLENTEKNNKKNTFLVEQGIDIDEFKEYKSFDEFMTLEQDKESDFIKALKEKKPSLFKAKKELEENKLEAEEDDIFGNKEVEETKGETKTYESKILENAFEDIK